MTLEELELIERVLKRALRYVAEKDETLRALTIVERDLKLNRLNPVTENYDNR